MYIHLMCNIYYRYCNKREPRQVFVDLMKAHDVNIVNSLANFIWEAFRIREQRLKELNI